MRTKSPCFAAKLKKFKEIPKSLQKSIEII